MLTQITQKSTGLGLDLGLGLEGAVFEHIPGLGVFTSSICEPNQRNSSLRRATVDRRRSDRVVGRVTTADTLAGRQRSQAAATAVHHGSAGPLAGT